MADVRHDEPEARDAAPGAQDDEPEWMQRMRAAGYNLRRGTDPTPLSEIPEVMFPPPVHPLLRAISWIPWGFRRVFRLGQTPFRRRNGSLP